MSPGALGALQYERLLAEYGITPAMLQHPLKEFSLTGTYRALVGRTRDLKWCGRRDHHGSSIQRL